MSSNNIRGSQKNSSHFWLTFTISLLCVLALVFTLVLVYRNTNNNKSSQHDGNLVNLTNQSLVSRSGWNEDVLTKLNELSSAYGDNVALGNSNGVNGVLISLGGYKWQVVYRENGILTLFMVDSLEGLDLETTTTNYRASKVREYLIYEFYTKFLEEVGFDNFDSYVIPSGDIRLTYQLQGMQNIEVNTVNGNQVVNNDITVNDKIWVPSVYEVGGYRIGENGSTSRVNSFNTDIVNGEYVASGLWNLTVNYRASKNAYLRSTTDDGRFLCLDENGVVVAKQSNAGFSVRPALNILLPSNLESELNYISSQSKTAISGAGTQQSPYTISSASDLIELSNNVLNGDTYSGKYVALANDIDLKGVTVWTPVGVYNSGTNSKPFSGTFDGQGFKISHASSANTGIVGLFGYVNGGTIKNIAVTATNWATAGDYAGGVVSVLANGATLSVSYNNSSVAGRNHVGGVVGSVNPSDGTACTINDVYNTGGVAGKTSIAGIVGSADNLTLSRCYNIGSVNVAKDIIGTSGAGVTITNAYYTAQQSQTTGTKLSNLETMRSASSYPGFDFYSSSNSNGVWFKSEILNDGFPTLKIFVKSVEIKLFTNNSVAGDYYATLPSSATKYKSTTTTLGTNVTFTAETASGYRFLGWFVAVMSVDGKAVVDSDEATLFNANATFNQAITDYLYLEARFVKTYTVSVSTLFGDFSTSYQNNNAVDVTYTGTRVGDMYDEGSVITISVNKTITELAYVGLGYKTSSSATTFTSIGKDLSNTNSYWESVSNNANAVVYVLVAGDSVAFTTDEFDIQVQFERQFNLSLSVTTDGVEKFPSAVVQFGTNGETLTASTTPNSRVFEYNVAGGLLLSVDLSNSLSNGSYLYDLDDWTFNYGESLSATLSAEATVLLVSTYISSNNSAHDSIYELELIANFSLNTFEVTASVQFDGTRETLDSGSAELAKVLLQNGTGQNVASISSNQTSLIVAQKTVVGICFIPNVAYGYRFSQLLVDSVAQTPTQNANGVYYYDYTMQPKNVAVVIKVNYLPINMAISVNSHSNNTYDTISSGVTLTPSSYTNANYYTNISALSLAVATTNNLNLCYALESVDASLNGGTTYSSIATYNNQQGQASYTFFANNTAISFVYQQLSQQLTTSNTNISLRIVLRPINQTLTLIAYYKGTSDVVSSEVYQLTLSSSNQISADTTTNVFSYVYGTNVQITTQSLNLGHRVLGYGAQANQASGFSGTPTNGYANTATFSSFNITENTTLYIYFELRVFTITFESNANTIASGTATLADQGIVARDTEQVGNLTLAFNTSSTTQSTIEMLYGHTLAFYAAGDTTVNAKNLRLVSITIKNGTTDAQIKQLRQTTQSAPVMAPNEEEIISMVEQNNAIVDNIKIVFRYNFKQVVQIKFASTVTNPEVLEGATIQFNNEDIQGYNLGVQLTSQVINTIQTNLNGYELVLTADEDGTTYNVTFLMNISYVLTDTTTNTTNTQFEIYLDGGAPIVIEISSITYNNNAINITGYFVFAQ